jgi:divalent metal cation (Fe/Co/Zn/Cd) transporter
MTGLGLSTERLHQRGLLLEYATLGWNVVGVVIMAVAAIRAGSVGLAGFGLDSLIEIFASVVVVWQLKGVGQDREGSAMRLIGDAFGFLAVYIAVSLIITFVGGAHPRPSTLGLIWLAATCLTMVVLALGKQVTGRDLGNPVLIAESKVTMVDAALAFAVLIGVGLNALFGWWWADPLSGLVVLGYAIKEGGAAWSHGAG